jgi:hypothetical protein
MRQQATLLAALCPSPFLSERSQQHFLSGRGILSALGEQLYIKHDVFVVGVTRHFDLHSAFRPPLGISTSTGRALN